MVKRDNTKESFTTRLMHACQHAGFTGHGKNTQLAEALKKVGVEVSMPGVWKWFNSQAIPDSDKILALSKVLGVRAEWLEYGAGTPTVPGDSTQEPMRRQSKTFRVDVLDITVSAGPGSYMLSEVVEVLTAIEFTNEHARALFGNRQAKDIKVMTVDGDSMSPTIKSGDRLFFDVSVREFKTDGVYAFVFGKTFHVKRLQMQGAQLAVLSDNPNLEKWYIQESDQDQFYVMGKALLHESIQYGKL